MALTESQFIRGVRDRWGGDPSVEGVLLGIGDDAALLAASSGSIAVTADMLIDGVDFILSECGYRRAGAKGMKKNLSDLAAMGVAPWCGFLSVALPKGIEPNDVSELLDGISDVADHYGAPIVGGDTKRSPGPLILSFQLLGRAPTGRVARRDGAVPGDLLFVTGRLGGSSLGRHLDFLPRVEAGLRLVGEHRVHAMIDLSDGLSTDLHHLCDASDVGAVVHGEKVPVSAEAIELARRDGVDALDHALNDGEDYELLFTLSPTQADRMLADGEWPVDVTVTEIGRITERSEGVSLSDRGETRPLAAEGFEHRFGSDSRARP